MFADVCGFLGSRARIQLPGRLPRARISKLSTTRYQPRPQIDLLGFDLKLSTMQAPPVPPPDPSWSTLSSRNVAKTRRSYVLQRDFRVLEREQKVSTLLGSEAFREELENILRGQLEGTGEPKRTRAQSPGTVSPGRADLGHKSRLPAAAAMVGGAGGEPVIPINDLRGASASKYTVAEREHRCKLASVYRLVHMFGWSQLIYNHITVSWGWGWGMMIDNEVGISSSICYDVIHATYVQYIKNLHPHPGLCSWRA